MPAPIDYGVQIADPTQSFLSAFQAGASIQDARFKQEQQQQQMANQKLIQEGFAKLRQPGATAADYANLAMVLPETQAKSVRESFNMLSGERQQNALQQSGQVFSAFKAGKPEIAIGLLERQIEAKRNSGDNEGAMFLETWRNVAKENPKATEDYFGFTISQIPGGDKIIESAVKLGAERRTEALQPSVLTKSEQDAKKATSEAEIKAIESQFAERLQQAGLTEKNWNVKNLQSQIGDRSQRLKLDQQTTAASVAEKLSSIQKNLNDIPPDTRKFINEAAVSGAVAKQSADQFNDLAKRIEGLGGYGKLATLGEFAKSTIGAEGYETSLRQEYTRLRNQAAIKSLPPGPATDKDIEMALKGFPKDTSDSKSIAQFLKGMAKLQEIESAVSNSKTDWLAQNSGTLTRARSSFAAGDYAVKPGETFSDFSQRVAVDVNKKYASGGSSLLVEQIPTDRNPTPGAAQANVRSQADAILRGGK